MNRRERVGLLRRRLTAAGVVAAVAVAGWWAGRETTVERTASAETAAEQVIARAVPVVVGRTLNYAVTVEQPYEVVASNTLAGVVTEASVGAQVDVGDVIYAVGATSVRAVRGDVPFWRDLTEGIEGPDVRQLQEALVALGQLATPADGRLGPSTVRSIRSWQKQTGQDPTGTIALGTLVAVPTLPAVIDLDESIRRGLMVSGGEPAVLTRISQPQFALVLNDDQASGIAVGTRVDVTSGEHVWAAVVSTISASPDQSGLVELGLTAPDGSAVCGAECGSLPAQETTYLTAQVHVGDAAEGPGVPVAALHTDASGATYVIVRSGERQAVTVLGSSDGMAVVEGLDVGDEIVLLGADPSGETSPSAGTAATEAGSGGQ